MSDNGTDLKEINRQHQLALALVENGLQFASSSPSTHSSPNEIPLSKKRFPISELLNEYFKTHIAKKDNDIVNKEADNGDEKKQQEEEMEPSTSDGNSHANKDNEEKQRTDLANQFDKLYGPFWSSRGYADISLLQSLIQEGYKSNATTLKNKNKLHENPKDDNPATTATTTATNNNHNKYKMQTNNKKSSNSSSSGDTNTNASTSLLDNTSLKNRPKYTSADIVSKTNYWCPANATVNNIYICRPSHDNWGIGKIILIFCDDFIHDIYHMPWWWQKEEKAYFRIAIQPILDVLKISESRIVRLLLASLPPGVTIPVHSDSGEWVHSTHRVHCPVIVSDPSKVVFQCGSTRYTMQNIPCTPGHVFEINNQANHFVSNCSDDHRVHLILDYIDDIDPGNDQLRTSQKQPIQLQPGEVILQTRRSMDRLINKGLRPTPSFFILGAQKAGTTTLYELINEHPWVIRARRRETHCFDWRWNTSIPEDNIEKHRIWCQKFFYTADLLYHPSCLTGDSTPSYLIDSSRVIPRIQKICNWPIKFFVTLREPVKRCESHYAMVTSTTDGTPEQMKARGYEWHTKSFQQVMYEELYNMQQCGLIPYWNIHGVEGKEFDSIVFHTFAGSIEEDKAWDKYLSKHVSLNTGSYGLLSRGLYELNLRPWIRSFNIDQFYIIKLEDDMMHPQQIQQTMHDIWKHLNVPPLSNKSSCNTSITTTQDDFVPKNKRQYGPIIDEKTKSYLQRFYQPHNDRLQGLLISDELRNQCNYEKWSLQSWKYE